MSNNFNISVSYEVQLNDKRIATCKSLEDSVQMRDHFIEFVKANKFYFTELITIKVIEVTTIV